ncbi:MAG: SNF2-related protein [Chlamydiales bacterium]|nr:SNF2-related protein [Chlamydiales bacterium]
MKEWNVHVLTKYSFEGSSGLKLKLQLSPSGKASPSARLITEDQLQSTFASDTLLKSLMEEHVKQLRSSGRYEGRHSLNFSTLYLGKKKLCFYLRELAIKKRLFFNSKVVGYSDTLSKLKVLLNEATGNYSYSLSIQTGLQKDEYIKDALAFYEGPQSFVLFHDRLCILPEDFDPYFLKELWKEEKVLNQRTVDKIQKYYADSPDGVELEFEKQGKQEVALTPILRFKNNQLKLCSVEFDYGDSFIEAYDPSQEVEVNGNFLTRDSKRELLFLEDLDDLGITCVDRGSSCFICDSSNFYENLEMLKELGWKLISEKGQELLLCKNLQCELTPSDASFTLHLSLSYEDYGELSLENCIDAVKSKTRSICMKGIDLVLPFEKIHDELGETLDYLEAEDNGFKLRKVFLSKAEDLAKRFNKPELLRSKDSSKNYQLHGFQGELRSYQEVGVKWLREKYYCGYGALLADEMGLGKTVQVLAFLASLKSSKTHLIMCPKTLQGHWKHEISRFLPEARAEIFQGDIPENIDILIISYSQARLHAERLSKFSCDCFICDEAQFLKNENTQLFSSILLLPSRFRLTLSGTPLENSLSDVLSILTFLFPFDREQIQKVSTDEVKVKHLLNPFMLRRRKSEVLKELPEKVEKIVWLNLSEEEKQAYDAILRDSDLNPLEKLLRLRQFCCLPQLLVPHLQEGAKLQQVLQDAEQVVSEGKKLLVFSQFTTVLSILRDNMRDRGLAVDYIDGQTALKEREQKANSFQNASESSILLLSLKVGGSRP